MVSPIQPVDISAQQTLSSLIEYQHTYSPEMGYSPEASAEAFAYARWLICHLWHFKPDVFTLVFDAWEAAYHARERQQAAWYGTHCVTRKTGIALRQPGSTERVRLTSFRARIVAECAEDQAYLVRIRPPLRRPAFEVWLSMQEFWAMHWVEKYEEKDCRLFREAGAHRRELAARAIWLAHFPLVLRRKSDLVTVEHQEKRFYADSTDPFIAAYFPAGTADDDPWVSRDDTDEVT